MEITHSDPISTLLRKIMNKLPLARTKNIVVQELGDEILIYDLKAHKAFSLNETSATVYRSCDGKASFEDLIQKHKFDDGLIFLALDELKRNDLLEENQPYESPFVGMSRRDVIRKVGLASMVALPIIASLVAPSASMAQSLLPYLAACTLDSECSTGNCTQVNATFPQICCVPGVAIGRPPGTVHACAAVQGVCDSIASSSCCSGTSTLSSTSCGAGVFNCVCD